jgi:hypothetical protein
MNTAAPTRSPQPRAVYTKELKAFLGHGDQRVLLLNGGWGTGKTHFWHNFVRSHRDNIENGFYSYVSLFGATSIAGVRASIVLSGEANRNPTELNVRWQVTKNWFVRKRRYFDQLTIPYVGGIGALVPKAEELLITDFLVCFDDLERRHRGLDLEQLFGLVAVLKEQNHCRVVIICNEDELSRRDRRALDKYREKIVDRELTYDPQFTENFKVIFSADEVAVREVFERLRLNNIRVFQQTKWCIRYFEPLLRDCHPAFVQRFHQQCAKLAAVHFAYSKSVALEEVKSRHWMVEGWRKRTETSDAASELIEQLQFIKSDADDFIIEYLRNGYCDFSKLEPVVVTMNHQHKRSEGEVALGRFWEHVWDTYAVNTADLVREAKELLNDYHPYLPFRYTVDVLTFVRRIDPEFDPEPLKEAAAKSLIPDADVSTLRSILAQCKSEEILQAARQREAIVKPRRSIGDLIRSLGESNGWNSEDFRSLDEFSVDELYEWVSTAADSNILYMLAEAIARGQLEPAANQRGVEVGRKFRTVFDRLAERSVLDSQRTVRTFERIRSVLKAFGKEPAADICPPAPAADGALRNQPEPQEV